MQVRTRKFRSGRFHPITSSSHCKFVTTEVLSHVYKMYIRIKMFFFFVLFFVLFFFTFLDVFIFNVL